MASAQDVFQKMILLSKRIPADCGGHAREIYEYTRGCAFCQREFQIPCCKRYWDTCEACGSQMCSHCRESVIARFKTSDNILCHICAYIHKQKKLFLENPPKIEPWETIPRVNQSSSHQKERTITSAQKTESASTLAEIAQSTPDLMRAISPKTARCVVAGLPGGVATADITHVKDADHICVSNVQGLNLSKESQSDKLKDLFM